MINAAITAAVLSCPALIYAIIVRRRHRLKWSEIAKRLGLPLGVARAYPVAFVVLLISVAASYLQVNAGLAFVDNEYSPLFQFVGAGLTRETVIAALAYALIATALWEELIFRGLIAGVLFRRLSFWKANCLQAAIFLLPHLLVLLVAPELWWFVLLVITALGLVLGWLRYWSRSIWPPWIVHSGGNFAVASFVAMT